MKKALNSKAQLHDVMQSLDHQIAALHQARLLLLEGAVPARVPRRRSSTPLTMSLVPKKARQRAPRED